jgi:hypothetical protein
MGLQQGQSAMSEGVVIGVNANEHDGFASPFLDRHIRLLRGLLGPRETGTETHSRENRDSTWE